MANYQPGKEPDEIKDYLMDFLDDLDNEYPDRKIRWSEWDRERNGKKAGYFAKVLGYSRKSDFLRAYGYTIIAPNTERSAPARSKDEHLVPASCTKCGASLKVDPSQERAVCEYCGTTFLVKKAINNYNINNIENVAIHRADNITLNKKGAIESALGFADKQIDRVQNIIAGERNRLEKKKQEEEIKRKEEEERQKEEWIRMRKWIPLIMVGIAVFLIILAVIVGMDSRDKEDAGMIHPPLSSSSIIGKDYEAVVNEFEAAGFTNIKLKPIDDIYLGIFSKIDTVNDVSVAGDSSFTTSSYYLPDSLVLITYHVQAGSLSTEGGNGDGADGQATQGGQSSQGGTQQEGQVSLPIAPVQQYPELKKGDQGSSVVDLQCRLTALGFDTNGIDGDYGSGTETAILAFQERNGLTLSGVATSETQTVLFSSNAKNSNNETAVSYSTNSQEEARNGRTGLFAYKSKGGQYDIYYIVDFNMGFVYRFLSNESSCDRVKIDSGDLCTQVMITYHDAGDTWMNGLHFKYNRQPDHLILEDHNHFETDFYTTNLTEALKIRTTKTIIDY